MKHPLEIFLTACEWVEDWRAKASAGKWRKKTERNPFPTFLAQGAVAGAFVYFVALVVMMVFSKEGYNVVLLIILPFCLVFGSLYGSITAVFVWFPEWVLKRRFGFLARATFAMTATSLLTIAFIYLLEVSEDQSVLSWGLGFICGLGLAVAIVTGSRIRPCRLLVFGAGRRAAFRDVGGWLSTPFGFLLRTVSVLGLLEALMVLVASISERSADSLWSAPPGHLLAIGPIVLYFAISSYLSFKTPSKGFLLPMAILLNLPLAVWVVPLRVIDTIGSYFLSYLSLGFVSLWVLYTLGRVITPESAPGAVVSEVKVVRLDYSRREHSGQLRSVGL